MADQVYLLVYELARGASNISPDPSKMTNTRTTDMPVSGAFFSTSDTI
jgi:hypothetical protein